MMNKNDQQFMAQKIRTQYMEKQSTELDALRELDAKVKRPANVFAYVFGSISAIVMGAGMSLVMTDIGATIGIASTMVPGIVIGLVGMMMALVNYPMYKGILNSRKKKYAEQILTLSETILNQQEGEAK
ncbi:MAG: dihydropteridine reductase [Clostridia bacterium]|nr:dihydropteridine reductase [Clostridia bacterium]